MESLLCALVMIFSSALAADAAGKTHVDASATPQGIAVITRARIDAPLAVIWQTLTDYDHLAEFIPGMTTSRTLTRCGNNVVVAQTGSAVASLFNYPIDIVVETEEHPPTDISVRILSGNLRTYQGAYHLEPVAGVEDSFDLSWSGVVEPEISLPGFIIGWGLRQVVEDEFRAMIAEIERRNGLYRQGQLNLNPTPTAACSRLVQVGRGG